MDAFIPVLIEIIKSNGAFVGVPIAIILTVYFVQKYKPALENPCKFHQEVEGHLDVLNKKIECVVDTQRKEYNEMSTDIKLLNKDMQYVKRDIQQITEAMPQFATKMESHKESFELLIDRIKIDMDDNMKRIIKAIEK